VHLLVHMVIAAMVLVWLQVVLQSVLHGKNNMPSCIYHKKKVHLLVHMVIAFYRLLLRSLSVSVLGCILYLLFKKIREY